MYLDEAQTDDTSRFFKVMNTGSDYPDGNWRVFRGEAIWPIS